MTTIEFPAAHQQVRSHPAALHLGGNLPGGDPRCYFPELWDWLIAKYVVKSVFDVGCGEGHAMAYFRDRHCEVIGLDGLPDNALRASMQAPTILYDLTRGPCGNVRADLVWCCEVVEHVDERYLSNVLDTITVGRVLAMTHALPGQPGWHHVNCQPPEYWIKAIESRGMRFDYGATMQSRSLDNQGFWGLSGLIFTRGRIVDAGPWEGSTA